VPGRTGSHLWPWNGAGVVPSAQKSWGPSAGSVYGGSLEGRQHFGLDLSLVDFEVVVGWIDFDSFGFGVSYLEYKRDGVIHTGQ
jgi:hypothetical protein